ncbi:TonB-dependent receptor domain-containing protein [Sphingomonas koreensis]
MRLRYGIRNGLVAAVAIGALMPAVPVAAQEQVRREYDLEVQDLGEALRVVGRLSEQEILFPAEVVDGKRAPRLRGKFSAKEAVRLLLRGTDLVADFRQDGILIRGRSQASDEVADRPTDSGEIVVTGSRLRGVPPTSPVLTLARRELQDAGFSNLGDVIRAIPQNFAGGQNPTVSGGGSQGAANQNTTSSSTFNLRGLGPDATLTLLNGHRMPYDGVFQGVDISSIPLAAIDRIEIVTDGASAIYGSDAVAGVANILLKRSFDGLESSITYGGSTDGGNRQFRAGVVAGSDWRTGGLMVAFDFSKQSEILAGQRDYAKVMQAEQTLVPRLKQYSTILSGYQDIGDTVRFEFDATYNRRKSRIQTPNTNAANYLQAGALSRFDIETFSLSPVLRFDLAPSWLGYVSGTYAESRAHLLSQLFSKGTVTTDVPVDYVNVLKTVEGGLSGSLASLPGGAVKLAVGGGYRSNVLDALARTVTPSLQRTSFDFTKGRDSWYGFAELNVPLVGGGNAVPLVRRLVASAAVRYENYPGLGDIVTPKAGIVYSPSAAFDLSISWGRSFKAPTLYQQFLSKTVILRASTAYGTTKFAAGATVLGLSGGNPDTLTPEHADTLTIAGTIRPAFARGFEVQLGYYRVRYRDRVIAPITSNLGIFENPIYAPFITYSPSAAQINAAIANAAGGVIIVSGGPYNPARVSAIVDNRQHNSSRQDIEGLDLSVRHDFALGSGKAQFVGSATYLKSQQILVAGQPAIDLAGTIYFPAQWRARGGIQWRRGGLSVSTFVNFASQNRDRRISPERTVPSFTTWDAALTYRIPQSDSLLGGLELALAANNILNTAPGRIRQATTIEPVYDSTNASPAGRFLSLSIRKQW